MLNSYQVIGLAPPKILTEDSDLATEIIQLALVLGGMQEGDIVVVASKVVSIVENQRVYYRDVLASDKAKELAVQLSKPAEQIQLVLDESVSYEARPGRPIIAIHRHGYRLTSAGVDKDGSEAAFLIPEDPDESATNIRSAILARTGLNAVAVIVSDSDGREDRGGATMIALGSSGIDPIRRTHPDGEDGKVQEETLVDLIAGSAGVVMGQRGRGVPFALIRGLEYESSSLGVRSIIHPSDRGV